MQNTRSVRLEVRVPDEMAKQVETVQHSDPEFFSQLVLYGLIRRSAYRGLQEAHSANGAIARRRSTSEQHFIQ